MVCLACGVLGGASLCRECRVGLRPGGDRLLSHGLRVRSAFEHRGPARALVHNFKYRGIEPAGRLLAEAMAPLIPEGSILIPLPRPGWRRLRYGIDPAPTLARYLAGLTSGAVVSMFGAPFLSPAQAYLSRSRRRPPMFRASLQGHLPAGGLVVLVDDVVTTGGTIESAWRTLRREMSIGPSGAVLSMMAVTATGAGSN